MDKIKRITALFSLVVLLVCNSMTAFASVVDCELGHHNFTVTSYNYHHRTSNNDRHYHYDSTTGVYQECVSYTYYYVVSQTCGVCHGVITIPGYSERIVHVRQ